MNTDTKVILGAIVASLIILVGAIVVLGKDASPKRENLGAASMTLDKKEEDLGTMKATDERSALFTITNIGNTTLRIWGISTSCNCTFASLIIGGIETGEFNMPMHTTGALKNWVGEVPAGQTAQLKAVYRPKVMPVNGLVSRQIRFSTNDPKNPEVEVSVKANVL